MMKETIKLNNIFFYSYYIKIIIDTIFLNAYELIKLEKFNKTVCPSAKASQFNVIFGIN